MNIVSCKEVLDMVLEEANERFGALWNVDEEKLSILYEYCDEIDCLAEEVYAESFDVEVDEVKMTISVSIECATFTVKRGLSDYADLVARCVSHSFSQNEDENVVAKFVFPSIWTKAF